MDLAQNNREVIITVDEQETLGMESPLGLDQLTHDMVITVPSVIRKQLSHIASLGLNPSVSRQT